MDNFKIDITCEDMATLKVAMRIAFEHNHGPAKAYYISKEHGLVFCWYLYSSNVQYQEFPFLMDADGAADFAWRWLAEQDYGKQPDHDGDNEKGWRLYCDNWGHVGGNQGSICGVQPIWAMYGK